ncbi:MAG: hypothetical protein L0H20_13815 [Corynebacterium sp.]|uniref:hypothetical protein n=1 Tax=Corynebacterium sp. TaxID=1720 RepID=UPI002649F264|nr:hypothetical protein [Corynebacterium sp.]MDN5724047.1 hypothetical protein [Corynebacterium sp.]
MTTKPGKLLEKLSLDTGSGTIDAEIRLVIADNGVEMLWHYENGRHAFAHPAKRCSICVEVITSSHIGTRYYDCAAADGLHL